jgi:hypothetical protein
LLHVGRQTKGAGPAKIRVAAAMKGRHFPLPAGTVAKVVGAVPIGHVADWVKRVRKVVGDHLGVIGGLGRHEPADVTLRITGLGRPRAVVGAVALRRKGAPATVSPVLFGWFRTHGRRLWSVDLGERLSRLGVVMAAEAAAAWPGAMRSRWMFVFCAGRSRVGRVDLAVLVAPTIVGVCRTVLVAALSRWLPFVVDRIGLRRASRSWIVAADHSWWSSARRSEGISIIAFAEFKSKDGQ